MIKEVVSFIIEYEQKVYPVYKKYGETFFNASISGKSEDYQAAAELELELNKIHSDKESYEFLKKVKLSGELKDQVLIRQVELLTNTFAKHQFDEELQSDIVKLSSKIEETFATFRASVNGEMITDNRIDEILSSSTDETELYETWKASKQVGKKIEEDVKQLIRLRNLAARKMGYTDYHRMSLELNEFNVTEIHDFLDNLYLQTESDFTKLKTEIDLFLSAKLGIDSTELRPWHYQDKFFQDCPKIYSFDADEYFKDKDILEITQSYYDSIGLDISDIIKNSDLYEKEGKYQHAYCININKTDDVRVLCNLKSNYRWMGTNLHEFGHAVYDKYVNKDLPWILREPSHVFTTEAIAMLFGRFAGHPDFINNYLEIESDKLDELKLVHQKIRRAELLIFIRWALVVFKFESELYSNPEQDLNLLWKNLVKKYQLINFPAERNEPDWASKIHIALYPAYYQNYILGEVLASQLFYYINSKVLELNENDFGCFLNKPEVGQYLINLFFGYGSLYGWQELIKKATGESLNPEYLIKEFKK